MKLLFTILVCSILCGGAKAESIEMRELQPLQFQAETPSWQDYSKIKFFIAKKDENTLILAIIPSGKQLYDVTMEIMVESEVVVSNQVVLKELHHSRMAILEIKCNLFTPDISLARITRFSAITK